MTPVIHIGPPKTASTSLQSAVVPFLGRPFLIRPEWTYDLAKGRPFDPGAVPADVLLSDEILGEFFGLRPQAIAESLRRVFRNGGLVIYVSREPVAHLMSYYRQQLVNSLSQLKEGSTPEELGTPSTLDHYFDVMADIYRKHGTGPFAMMLIGRVRRAFEQHFEFLDLPYDLLTEQPAEFVGRFGAACGTQCNIPLPRENAASGEMFERLLVAASNGVSEKYLAPWRLAYAAPQLSTDRTRFLRKIVAQSQSESATDQSEAPSQL